MRVEEAKNYEMFKKRARQRCGFSTEHLMRIFRGLIKLKEETFSQLTCRLDRIWAGWLEQSNVNALEDVRNVIGQFYNILNPELRCLVQDRAPKSVKEAEDLADLISTV